MDSFWFFKASEPEFTELTNDQDSVNSLILQILVQTIRQLAVEHDLQDFLDKQDNE